MKTITTTEARKNMARLTKEVATSHEPFQLSTKYGGIILIAQEDWEALQETLYIDSIPGLSDSIIKGMNTPISECKDSLTW